MERRDGDQLVLLAVVLLVPALVCLLRLGTPIPEGAYPAREIAGHFQALALLRDGLQSYFYFTPDESFTALHLHSLLSAPLLAIGWTEGGRFVSLLSMTGAAVTVVAIARHLLESRRAGIVAAALFWVHPWVLTTATAYTPDALGIFLTTLSVYGALRYVDGGSVWWFALLLSATSLGAVNHMWELSIGLTVTAILLWNRSYREWLIYGAVAGVSAVAVVLVTSLQPVGTTSHAGFSVLSSPTSLVRPEVWFGHLASPHPVNVDVTLSVLTAMGVAVAVSAVAWRTRHRLWVVLAAWLWSAVLVPLLLPVGYEAHLYYSWGVYAPLAVTGAAVLLRLDFSVPVPAVGLSSVVVAVGYVLVFEIAILNGVVASPALVQATTPVVEQETGLTHEQTAAVAAELRRRDVPPEEIAFTGDWGHTERPPTDVWNYREALGISQVLVYSDMLVRSRVLNGPDAPKLVADGTDCTLVVHRSGDHISIRPCDAGGGSA